VPPWCNRVPLGFECSPIRRVDEVYGVTFESEVGQVKRAIWTGWVLALAIGCLAVSQTSANIALRVIPVAGGTVYLIDNNTGLTQTRLVLSFSAATILQSEDITVFGGGAVTAIHIWGGGLLVAIDAELIAGGTVQVSLLGDNGKKAIRGAWFSAAT
jgi:hypothetical protein